MSTAITASAEARGSASTSATTSLRQAMNSFFDRDDHESKLGTRDDYDFTLTLLEEFINTYGRILLRVSEVSPAIRVSNDDLTSECYAPGSLVQFFRAFILFFLQYKLNAPQDKKETFVKITEELVVWLSEKGHVPKDFQSQFDNFDMETIYGAAQAANILGKAVVHIESSRRNPEDLRGGEPLYMISRVKAGKLWFVYYSGDEYDDFGPVCVPLGVSDLVRPGWLIDCEFGKYNGRWQLKSVGDILPV